MSKSRVISPDYTIIVSDISLFTLVVVDLNGDVQFHPSGTQQQLLHLLAHQPKFSQERCHTPQPKFSQENTTCLYVTVRRKSQNMQLMIFLFSSQVHGMPHHIYKYISLYCNKAIIQSKRKRPKWIIPLNPIKSVYIKKYIWDENLKK